MDSAERILCALSREQPDRVPIYDLVSSRALLEYWAAEPINLENAGVLIPRAIGRGLDMSRVFLPAQPGRRIDHQGFTFDRTDWFNEWQVGAPYQSIEELAAFVGREIERVEAETYPNGGGTLNDLRRWKQAYNGAVIPASWAGEPLQDAYIRIGLDWFVWLDAEYPALVKRWIAAIHANLLRRLESEAGCREISPVAWIFGDVAYKDRLIFSPAFLHRHGFFDRLAEICHLYHAYQLKVIFHSDGYIWLIIPDLIKAGVDAIAPVDTSAGMNLAVLKQTFGHKLAFVGGIDVETILRQGTPDSVYAATCLAIDQAADGGGFILGSSSEELFDNLPLANILAMHRAAHGYGQYPIQRNRR